MTTSTTGPSGKSGTPGCACRRRIARIGSSLCPMRGFTLLELVLVMVIMCTVLAMAAPSLRGFFASRQTADAAAQIAALTRFARAQAVAEGTTYRFNLDTETGKYWLTMQAGGVFAALPTEFGRSFSLPEGTSATWESPAEVAARGWVAFHPDGRTEAARIRLVGRQGASFEIGCPSPTEQFHVLTPPAGGH